MHHPPLSRLMIQYLIFCPYLSRFRLIRALKDEDEFQSNRVRPYLLDRTRGLHQRSRNPKLVANDRHITNLVNDFDLIQNPNIAQILHHLRALQYRLAGFNIEDWI